MKKGFTLIELLVYMAIMGLIIVVAGKVFSDATGMRVRTQNMTKATEVANATATLLKEDLSRMGAKEWQEDEDEYIFTVANDVYRNLAATGGDTSSYVLTRAETEDGKYDSIVFNAIDLLSAENGNIEAAVREITYSVNEERELIRQCETIAGDGNEDCPEENPAVVIVASDVERFSLNPSIPGVPRATLEESIDSANAPTYFFPDDPNDQTTNRNFFFYENTSSNGEDILDLTVEGNNGNNSTNLTLKSFTKTEKDEKKYAQVLFSETSANECTLYNFIPGETYVIEFDMMNNSLKNEKVCRMCMFQAGEDHIAVGLRNANFTELPENQRVPDFTVYPPIDKNNVKLRHQEFSIPVINDNNYNPVPACVSLTFAFYSEYVSGGQLEFSDFNIYRKKDAVYHFASCKEEDDEECNENYIYNPDVTDGTDIRDKANVKAFELELQIKVKDEFATAKVIIPTPNNGVFIKSTDTGGNL